MPNNRPADPATHDQSKVKHDAKEPIDGTRESSLSTTVACKDVTGIDCDFVAKPDDSAQWAERGNVSDQLLTQITTHIGTVHPERVLSQGEIEKLRKKITTPGGGEQWLKNSTGARFTQESEEPSPEAQRGSAPAGHTGDGAIPVGTPVRE